jgi:hypothetical protein
MMGRTNPHGPGKWKSKPKPIMFVELTNEWRI